MTTAASIWIVSSIGMALGTKMYYLALVVTILCFLTLSILKYVEDRILRLPNYTIRITTSESFKDLEKITGLFEKLSVNIKGKKYRFDSEKNKKIFNINLYSNCLLYTSQPFWLNNVPSRSVYITFRSFKFSFISLQLFLKKLYSAIFPFLFIPFLFMKFSHWLT